MTSIATLRVCVVDDEARLRELLVREIGVMGHAATGFCTAEDAWPALQDGQFDVAFVDLNLPGMGGMELFERIRAQQLDTAVVILTGFGSLETAVQSLRWDADDYLTKPCSLDQVEAVLTRLRTERRRSALPNGGAADVSVTSGASASGALSAAQTLEDLERQQILSTLSRHGGNKPATAQELGISLRTLYNKLNTYRVQGHLR